MECQVKKLFRCIYVNLILGCAFTLTCLSFRPDVSLSAFPLSLLFTGLISWFVIFKFIRADSIKRLGAVRRLFQYEPFVYISAFVLQRAGKSAMPFALDLAASLIWVAVTVTSFVILYMLGEKRVYSLSAAWADEHKAAPPKKRRGMARVVMEMLEWADAVIQAVFTIILLNIFFFQLYEIPSESMVPEFLVKDRVIVFKTPAGPKFPLSDVGLPRIQRYDRGDIVVFRNPHYGTERSNEVRTFLSQFVYMVTLTLVNINTDENGELKADPLVKRVTGIPGEQLMMMDGTLYARTASSGGEFLPVRQDADWAMWNMTECGSLYSTADGTLRVERLPISEITRAQIKSRRNGYSAPYTLTQALEIEAGLAAETLEVEEGRRNLDLVSARLECERLAGEFRRYAGGRKTAAGGVMFGKNDLLSHRFLTSLFENTRVLLNAQGGADWFASFMNGWHQGLEHLERYTEDGGVTGSHLMGGNLYDDALFRLNVMCKLTAGRVMVRYAKLISDGVPMAQWTDDAELMSGLQEAQKLVNYILHMNQRSMPVFPPDNADGSACYIPEDSYFMMGDNRYNSLDMRHSYDYRVESLWASDPLSMAYYSNMEPRLVHRSRILGKASYRFWPVSRAGVPGKKSIRDRK